MQHAGMTKVEASGELLEPAPDPVADDGAAALSPPGARALEVTRGNPSPGQLVEEAAGVLPKLSTLLDSEWNQPVSVLDQGSGGVSVVGREFRTLPVTGDTAGLGVSPRDALGANGGHRAIQE